LCVTGLPLIFKHEIDHLLHEEVEPAEVPAGTPKANLERVVAAGLARHPDRVVQFIIWDRDEPSVVMLSVGKSYDSDPAKNEIVRVDAHTGQYLDTPDFRSHLTCILYRLHVDMFADLAGKLFLGLMGLVRRSDRLRRGGLCAIDAEARVWHRAAPPAEARALARPAQSLRHRHGRVGPGGRLHRRDQHLGGCDPENLAVRPAFEMAGPFKSMPVPQKLASIEDSVQTAQRAVPGMIPFFVAYPGTPFTSSAHYAVFMRGDTPLTSRLLKPALINAATGEFTDSRDMPWYVNALLVSQPLRFGDYGGMPMKVIWAVLDVITIVVLGSGLYLWLRRPRVRREAETPEAIAQQT
jgi:uncharacterized iron-regulated membrane protein